MLTLQKTDDATIVSTPISQRSIEDLLEKEWLLTNNRGGYASSTIIGCNTRRYHGLLIGSLNPPANRIMALSNCLEMVIVNGESPFRNGPISQKTAKGQPNKSQNGNAGEAFNLSTFEFNGKFAPQGFGFLTQFRRDIGVHFDYQLDKLALTKSVYLLHDADVAILVYDFTSVECKAEFVLRPFIGLRDFHTLQKFYAPLCSSSLSNGLLVHHNTPESCGLSLNCPAMDFEKDEQWWFNFIYRNDRERGQEFTEDLWTPGFFKCRIETPDKIIFWAELANSKKLNAARYTLNADIDAVLKNLQKHQDAVIASAARRPQADGKIRDKKLRKLCLAADQFVVETAGQPDSEPSKPPTVQLSRRRTTILAGFPWFADWGRDAFIALPGLLLETGRFDDAKSVLRSFAAVLDDGMIPNRFDDHSDTAYFNSIDASLWFINAAFQYLEASGDKEGFEQDLLAAICWVINSYQRGGRFGICADSDGLITAGNEQTQLTWMDAKYDGVAFTPRYGKAVEINALWYNSLRLMHRWISENQDTRLSGIVGDTQYHKVADKVGSSFCELFWNKGRGYLNDCIGPDGSVDATLRPNQIFAVSLPFSPLSAQQQKKVVEAIQKNLLTPFGLRTLHRGNRRYKGSYTGGQRERDKAYHNGTVWPYLIGPFIEAYLKVNDFSRDSKERASEFIKPLMDHLTSDGCLGQICEIFDGDAPHRPRGCIAQAWSVAELIRAYQLINN